MDRSDWVPASFFLGEFAALGIVWLVGWLIERRKNREKD